MKVNAAIAEILKRELHVIVPDATGSTAITLTAAREPAFVIGTGTVTAGAFTLVLYYK